MHVRALLACVAGWLCRMVGAISTAGSHRARQKAIGMLGSMGGIHCLLPASMIADTLAVIVSKKTRSELAATVSVST